MVAGSSNKHYEVMTPNSSSLFTKSTFISTYNEMIRVTYFCTHFNLLFTIKVYAIIVICLFQGQV